MFSYNSQVYNSQWVNLGHWKQHTQTNLQFSDEPMALEDCLNKTKWHQKLSVFFIYFWLRLLERNVTIVSLSGFVKTVCFTDTHFHSIKLFFLRVMNCKCLGSHWFLPCLPSHSTSLNKSISVFPTIWVRTKSVYKHNRLF